ncbi:hypothetical protein EZJ43_11700 [Pedobacter changchengzhani]|uniref:Uncharacterized protein n=1 Tax=Pedobacter changchengzhani TaxID=2529274 RepID=A0A4R5MJB8_9SPHI|nr:hypothetical protein [Pedobacter changchengzhani]TDG35680.1 hypothetical protein EZJ43_11700 [Pedobacter changchengzhani]
MKKIYFRYREHPGGFLRNTDITELPNIDNDLEDFLVWFLKNYQSDDRVTQLDDLYKLLDDEFTNENDKADFTESLGALSDREIVELIKIKEKELKDEAFQNFYSLILNDKIIITEHVEN